MPTDPGSDPLAGANYRGFSLPTQRPDPAGFEARRRPPPVPAARRPRSRGPLILAAGVALAMGATFGLLARPDLLPSRPAEPMRARVQSEAMVPVEVSLPAPAVEPRATEPLEVLSPGMAAAAPRLPAEPTPQPRPASTRVQAVADAPASRTFSVTRVAPAAQFEPPLYAEPSREEGPAFNCRYARSSAERMVCGDPQLAEADRRLNRAFDRAIASGAPRSALRADQDDWLDIREDAARFSRRAVVSVYEQRIEELQALADDLAG